MRGTERHCGYVSVTAIALYSFTAMKLGILKAKEMSGSVEKLRNFQEINSKKCHIHLISTLAECVTQLMRACHPDPYTDASPHCPITLYAAVPCTSPCYLNITEQTAV
jgi:hypothetical protein